MVPKISLKQRLSNYVKQYGKEQFKHDGHILYCIPCERAIPGASSKKSFVSQHVATQEHQRNLARKQNSEQAEQAFLSQCTSSKPTKQQVFNSKLTKALLFSDIPISKLRQPAFKEFLEWASGCTIPSTTTIRQNYMPNLYEDEIRKLQTRFKGQRIWVGLDELTDSVGRCVAGVVAGCLKVDAPERSYVIHIEELERVNHTTIAATFTNALQIIWPGMVCVEFNLQISILEYL